MSVSGSVTAIPDAAPASLPAVSESRLPTPEIDASIRPLLLLLFNSALVWLTIALALLLISAIKLHAPGFLAGSPWLSFGRVHPTAMNAFLYGFASQAALGCMLWMFCRLGGNRLFLPVMAFIGAVGWNLGVTLGLAAILAGDSTGFRWLEMPGGAALILLGSYVLIGAAAGVTFHYRRVRELYVSQWFLLGALFWFPWIYSAANLLLLFSPVRGTVQSVVNAWFANNLLGLWLGPVALAAIYYFIPKLIERPLYNWWLAVFAFWTLAFFTNWSGLSSLVGGPVPAWMISVSIAANVLLVVPLIASAWNWHLTLCGAYQKIRSDMTLRYVAVGAFSYLAATLTGILLGLREIGTFTNFTWLELAQSQLALGGFVAMSFMGAIYYIVPRLLQAPWPSKGARWHFWLSTGGIALIFIAFTAGGLVQAGGLSDPLTPFVKVMRKTIPFIGVATLGWFIWLAGQVIFLVNLQMMLHRHTASWRKAVRDYLLTEPAELEARP